MKVSEKVKASTQYDDLKGTVAIDGWHGLSALSAGAGGRKGYVTVGVELFGTPDTEGGELDFDCYVYAVDESILEGDRPGPDAVRRYAKQHGRLPVFRFPSKLNIAKALRMVKRLSVVLQDKSTEWVPMMLPEDETFHDE